MLMKECISNNVHTLRIAKGITQEELAQSVGVSRQTVIAVEKGNYTPSVLLALKLAHVFKVSVEDVFTITHGK
jgi:putative transcriptional regulator